jgi:hypothetical protein
MSRGRIKCKVVESTIQNKDVLDMFHEVLGTGDKVDLNLGVVYPKYLAIRDHCGRFIRLLEALGQAPCLEAAPGGREAISAYAAKLRADHAEAFAAADLAAAHPPTPLEAATGLVARLDQVTFEEYSAFAEVYRGVKGCGLVNAIVVTVKNLLPHKGSLKDRAKLRDRFLKASGSTLSPLPDLPELNFKQLYISDRLSAGDRSFLLMILHKLYTVGHDVYEAVLAPDVDVQQFVQVILSSLEDVKRAIPRCDEAFDKIRESVGLLEGNFDGYWKDCVASGNPTIIMENFVLDVSKNTRASPKITAQFRRIIGFYREQAKTKADNPKLRTLFQQVDKNFQELERQSREAPEGEPSDSEEEEAGGGSDAEAAPGAAAPEVPGSEAPAPEAADLSRSKKAQKRADRRKRARESKKGAGAAPAHCRVLVAEGGEARGSEDAPPPPESDEGPCAPPEGEGLDGGAAQVAELLEKVQQLAFGGRGPEDGGGGGGEEGEEEEEEEEEDTRPPEERDNDAAAEWALEVALGLAPPSVREGGGAGDSSGGPPP